MSIPSVRDVLGPNSGLYMFLWVQTDKWVNIKHNYVFYLSNNFIWLF